MPILTLLLIAALVVFLARRGKIGPPPWVTHAGGPGGRFAAFSNSGQSGPEFQGSPEFEARKVLANRFANGDISPEEFLERAAALNWTPGVDHRPPQGTK